MPQLNQYIKKNDVPYKIYCELPRRSQQHFDYLFKLQDLMRLPAFDSLHSVRYEVVPGQWPENTKFAKGWQIISNLTPDRELRFYLKSYEASPKDPFFYGAFHVPTQVYEYFVDAANRGGFGDIILEYPQKQKNNLTDSDIWMKTLATDCIKCLKAAKRRQAESDQPQEVCLEEAGYSRLNDNDKQFFDSLKGGNVGEDELLQTIDVVYKITSWYSDKTRNG